MTLREVVEKGLGDDWPADANARADLLNRARDAAGYDTTLPVMKAILAEGGQTAGHRAGGTARTLQVALSQRKLTSYHATLDDQRWLGGRRYSLAGPLELAFTGGRLDLGRDGAVQVESKAGQPAGLAPSGLRLPLAGSWKMTVGGKTLSAESPGKAGQTLTGALLFEAPGVTLSLDSARVAVTAEGFEVSDSSSSR